MRCYVVMTAPKAWKDWIITIIISECKNIVCFLASHYHIIILMLMKLKTVIKVHACVVKYSLCQWGEPDVQRRKGETSSHTLRENPVVHFFVVPFFVDISIPSVKLAVRHRGHAENLTTELCTNWVPLPPTYIPWLHFYAFPQTRNLKAGITMCCPIALTVCPSSCSIFPDKYHPGNPSDT